MCKGEWVRLELDVNPALARVIENAARRHGWDVSKWLEWAVLKGVSIENTAFLMREALEGRGPVSCSGEG